MNELNKEYIDSEIEKIYTELDDIYTELDTLNEKTDAQNNDNVSTNIPDNNDKFILINNEFKDLNNDVDALNENIDTLNENIETIYKSITNDCDKREKIDNRIKKKIEKIEDSITLMEKVGKKEMKDNIVNSVEKMSNKLMKDIEKIIKIEQTRFLKDDVKIERNTNDPNDPNDPNYNTIVINSFEKMNNTLMEDIEKMNNTLMEDIEKTNNNLMENIEKEVKEVKDEQTTQLQLQENLAKEQENLAKEQEKLAINNNQNIIDINRKIDEFPKIDSTILKTTGDQTINGNLSTTNLNTQSIIRPNKTVKTTLWNDGTGDIDIGLNTTGTIQLGQGPMLKLSTSSAIIKSQLTIQNNFSRRLSNSVINKDNNVIYTPAQFLNGLINRYCNGIDKIDTTPSAIDLVSGIKCPVVGSSIDLIIRNASVKNEKLTINPGLGVIINTSESLDIYPGDTIHIIICLTNITPGKETASLYVLNYTSIVKNTDANADADEDADIIKKQIEENNKKFIEYEIKLDENEKKFIEYNTKLEENTILLNNYKTKLEEMQNIRQDNNNNNYIIKDSVIFKTFENSTLINYASWGGIMCPSNFLIDSTVLGISGTIVKIICTYNSHSGIKFKNLGSYSNLSFSIGKLDYQNIFSPYNGGNNVINWNVLNNNSYPSTTTDKLNINFSDNDKICIKMVETGSISPNDMKINVQVVIRLDNMQ